MHLFTRSSLVALAAIVSIAGCAGEDGANGANGANGTDGIDGTLPVATVESCAGCHNASLPTTHARINQVAVTNEAVADANAGADLAITFNVKVNGINRNDFTRLTTVRSWVYDATAGIEAGLRTTLTITTFTVTANGDGDYTITLPGYGSVGATPAVAGTTFLANVNTGNLQPTATVVASLTGAMAFSVVSNQACMNCHGEYVFSKLDPVTGIPLGHEDDYNPKGVEGCVVCHNRTTTTETRLAQNGTRLMGYVHGIHNSHNMPGANTTAGVPVAGGTYYRNGSILATSQFSIGFPGYMNNCSTCHTAAALATIAASPVTWQTCMSCHIGPPTTAGVAAGMAWAGFGVANTGTDATPVFSFNGQNHANFTAATTCATTNCHGDLAPATLAGFHNGLLTERRGLIWDGADQSVVEGAKFALAVTGVARVGANYQVSWTASYNGATISPCNTDFTVGPVFLGVVADAATGKAASNMQLVKAYGQGDDWVNAGRAGTVAPGQPATSATLTATNTNCTVDANVAVTTTPVDTFVAAGIKGTMALQGKPQLRFASAAATASEFIQARAKSPVFSFVLPAVDGTATAGSVRRTIVDTDKCLACHKGTLYQHGGNRVDSVDLCVTCHNPAANEMNIRVLFGVTASEAYDGKPGETYDMRTMVHAIHSAGETGRAYVVYRTRGIYFFGNAASFADVVANRNWPTTGGVTCNTAEGPVTYNPVFGSVASATDLVPIVNGDGTCNTTGGPASTVGVWQIHNVVLVEYPRPLSDCGACHAAAWVPAAVDATKGVAVTVDAGVAPWGNQIDDVLMGPTAASCMSCHQSGDSATQFGLRQHAGDFGGWDPTVFVNGRQTLIDAVTFP